MNMFGLLYGIMFWVSFVYFVCNPKGFVEESQRVLRSGAPKIINGHFGIPKDSHHRIQTKRAS